MKIWLPIAALVAAVMTAVPASTAGNCSSSKNGGEVTVICRVNNVHQVKIHLVSTATHNSLTWSVDCGGDSLAYANKRTVGRRYDILINARTNPAAYAGLSRHSCTVSASAKLTNYGTIALKVAAT